MQSNTLTVVGNVGDDPELRFTNSGTALAKFSLAVYAGKDKDSSWFDVTVWGQLAENVAESVTKGQRVMVLGRLEQQRWETPQGDKRSKVAIVADDVGPSCSGRPPRSRRPSARFPPSPSSATSRSDGRLPDSPVLHLRPSAGTPGRSVAPVRRTGGRIAAETEPNPETEMALRKLLEAKDAAVRAVVGRERRTDPSPSAHLQSGLGALLWLSEQSFPPTTPP